MMWISSLLVLIAFSSVLGQKDQLIATLGGCEDYLNKLDSVVDGRMKEQVEAACPAILGFFSCVDNALEEDLSLSLEDIVELFEEDDEESRNFLRMVINVKNVLTDLCTEGTQLNKDLLADIDCFDTFGWEDLGCQDKVPAAIAVYRDLSDELEDDNDDDVDVDEQQCVEMAFGAACMSAGIHERCGQRAFNTVNTILKRTTFFANMVCSREKLEELQTTVIDRLEMSEAEKDLFKLGLDLKRRRR